MSIYSITLFLHIVGALGFSVVLGLEWIGLWHLRNATQPEPVQVWMGIFKSTNRLGMISMPITIVTGIYMWLTVWGGVAWILVVLGALVLEIIIFVALSRPRMAALEQALAMEKRSLSPSFHNLANNSILWISVQIRVMIILGIVFLKIAMPNLGWSLLTIGVAIVLGLAPSFPESRRERAKERPAG